MTIFKEKQRFPLIWNMIILLVTVPAMAYLLYTEMSGGGSLSSLPYSIWFSLLMLIVVLAFINMIHLDTRIDKTGISVRFYPLHFQDRYYSWDTIESVEVRKYKPILEYGGWGWRKSLRNGTAYNIKGKMGLQLVFKDGSKLLIGTQKADDMQKALEKIWPVS